MGTSYAKGASITQAHTCLYLIMRKSATRCLGILAADPKKFNRPSAVSGGVSFPSGPRIPKCNRQGTLHLSIHECHRLRWRYDRGVSWGESATPTFFSPTSSVAHGLRTYKATDGLSANSSMLELLSRKQHLHTSSTSPHRPTIPTELHRHMLTQGQTMRI